MSRHTCKVQQNHLFAGTDPTLLGSAEAEIQAILPLCTYTIRTAGKVTRLAYDNAQNILIAL